MQFIANLFSKIGLFLFFVILEITAVFFMYQKSAFHKTIIGEQAMAVNGYFSEKASFITRYVNLPDENKRLLEENALLRKQLANSIQRTQIKLPDDSLHQKYTYKTAQIVDYSLRRKDNYFLLNKGRADGVEPDMAVVGPGGVVGAVLNTSAHYASVISVLHSKTNIKARVKGLNYFGIIQWPGLDHRKLSLKEIPKYLKVNVGDTVVTAGASAIYPEGELIGKVTNLKPNDKTGDFEIEVTTFEDLANVKNVYLIKNTDQTEIKQAESKQLDVSQ